MKQEKIFSENRIKDISEETKPFVFSANTDTPWATEVEKIDLPFKQISIEIAGDKNISQTDPMENMLGMLDPDFEVNTHSIICIIVTELSPKVYSFMVYFDFKDHGKIVRELKSSANPKETQWLIELVATFLNRLKYEKMGLEVGTPIRFKNPNNPKKKISIPKEHIYVVAPKKTYKTNFPSKKINWDHHIEVRGHWRKINGIGKDRDGIYCELGNTWIRPYSKGDKTKPLIKKTRIVQ